MRNRLHKVGLQGGWPFKTVSTNDMFYCMCSIRSFKIIMKANRRLQILHHHLWPIVLQLAGEKPHYLPGYQICLEKLSPNTCFTGWS